MSHLNHLAVHEKTSLLASPKAPVEGRIPLDDGTIPGQPNNNNNNNNNATTTTTTTTLNGSDTENGILLSKKDDAENTTHSWNWHRLFRILGPGLMVCLADTDGPCLLTAAQSGAQYQYSLVLCQLFLMWVLYAAQELTVRLAVCTKLGTTALIRERFGAPWAWFAVTLHVLMCWIGQASEFGAMGLLLEDAFQIPRHTTNTIQVIGLSGIVILGRWGYRFTELLGVAFGSLQLVFIGLLFCSQVQPTELWRGMGDFSHIKEDTYEILLAGNIGAVIMPWMLYYHQSAVCERQICRRDLPYERTDTALGAVLAQGVMTAMVISMGSLRYYTTEDPRNQLGFGDMIRAYAQALTGTTFGELQEGATTILDVQPTPPLLLEQDEVLARYEQELSTWYTPTAYTTAKWVVVLGVTGACTVASMVLTITSVWSVTEILNMDRDLFHPIQERPLQYALQLGGLLLAYGLSISTDISGPWFAVLTQTINGLLILPVAAFLWILASSPKVLPKEYRLQGWYKWILFVVFCIICAYCVYERICIRRK